MEMKNEDFQQPIQNPKEILDQNPKISSSLTPKEAYAIIVGISNYPGTTADLNYCDDDAQEVYAMLINEYNFKPENIIYLQDSSATKNAISNAFDQIASQINEDDVFFFYYSGHGGFGTEVGPITWIAETSHPYSNNYDHIWSISRTGAAYMRVHFYRFDCEYYYDYALCGDSDVASGWYYEAYSGNYGYNFWSAYIPVSRYYIRFVSDYSITGYGFKIDKYEAILDDGTHYLCSYDSIPNSPSNYYIDSLIDSKLDSINSTEKYVVVDSCYSGGVIPEVQEIGRYIMTACEDDESSLETSSLQHGVFSYYFLRSKEYATDTNGDGVISMEECYSYVYSNTVSYSGSLGYTHHPQQYDGITGPAVLYTTFGSVSLTPIGNSLSYSFILYGTGLIEELYIIVCNVTLDVVYEIEDLTINSSTSTGFGSYSGLIQLDGVSGFTGYGIFATIQGNREIILNNTVSEDTDNDSLEDIFEIFAGLDPLNNDTDSDGLSDSFEFNGDTDPLLNDTDNDGLLDGLEVLTYFTNATNPDTDGDGLIDGDEVFVYLTNATNIDSEYDGMDDYYEVFNDLDPLINDTSLDYDGDGLTNLIEYQLGSFANDSDSDNDGLLDGLEVLTYFTNCTNPDTDGDGLIDGDEVFIYLTNATNIDSEYDGMDDYYEVFNDLDPLIDDSNLDYDGDGLINLIEYQSGSFANDSDSDNDSMPDYYEYNNDLNLLQDDTELDYDGDGLSNLLEYQLGSLANNLDSDNDSMPDFYEYNNDLNLLEDDAELDYDGDGLTNLNEFTLDTNPQDPDTDNDGLTDGIEVSKYNTDPTNRDTDGDGYSDGIEVAWGTDPLNPKITLITAFLNIIGIVILSCVGSYSVYTQIVKKKRNKLQKPIKEKFSINKDQDLYNILKIEKKYKPKPKPKPTSYGYKPVYSAYAKPSTIPRQIDLNKIRDLILFGMPPPKPINSVDGQRALKIANMALEAITLGDIKKSFDYMINSLMLGVPEPTNSRIKSFILDSLNRSSGSSNNNSQGNLIGYKKCKWCGTQVKSTNKYCYNCGRLL